MSVPSSPSRNIIPGPVSACPSSRQESEALSVLSASGEHKTLPLPLCLDFGFDVNLPPWVSTEFLTPAIVHAIKITCASSSYSSAQSVLVSCLQSEPKALEPCSNVRTDLIPFVRVFFAPGVIQMVEKTFDYYDIEALPRSNLYSCALHIFAEYIVRCSAAGDVGGASSGEGTGTGAGAGGPSRGGGEGGGDGAAPGGGNDPSGAFPQATGPFGPSARRTISTVFQSLPRCQTQRARILNAVGHKVIGRAAIGFGSTFKQTSGLPSSLDLDNTQSTLVSIHHATRKSSLKSFLRRGINLGDDTKPNEFHHASAFYTSNVVANCVAHVLTYHHHPLLAAVDPVMVLSFVVDPRVLLGTIPNENGYLFRVKLLSVPSGPGYHVAFQAYRTFVQNNWQKNLTENEKAAANEYDFVIGPVCENPTANFGIAKSLDDGGPRLIQVAACSLVATLWLNNKIVEIAEEERRSPS